MFSSTASRFVLMLAAACNAMASATESPVELLTAGDYTILAKSGITNVPESTIVGDIGVSPIAGTAMTGFGFTEDVSEKFWTSAQLKDEGKAYAADSADPTPELLTTAVSAMEAAYTDAAGRVNPDAARINYGVGVLGGIFGGQFAKMTPGVYTFGSNVVIAENIYLEGNATDVFIFQITGTLTLAADKKVLLTGDVVASNVFWQVADVVEVADEAEMQGIILAKTSVVLKDNSVLSGRVLAQTACTLQKTTIIYPYV